MANVKNRARRRRKALRAAGLRPLQIGIHDTRREGFADGCRRQSKLAVQSDREDLELLRFMDEALFDVDDWS